MRILVDYRPALRARTGVGEYLHSLVKAYAAARTETVTVFTSSWKDRPSPALASELGVTVRDLRIPVSLLNLLWHRAEWPPIETLAGPFDVVHAAHPLIIPARRAAQVVTIHDLFFLDHPERTRGEVRRDYARLVPSHARRADAVVTSSAHTGALVERRLGVPADRIHVCPPGAPAWQTLGREPNVPARGYVLFLGTLEPRKNLTTLLDAFTLLAARATPPPLRLAGAATPDARDWLARIAQKPLSDHVHYLGYVNDSERERLFAGARALVLPSLDEGFGLTALEAMAAGVPVIASNRGSLPEVVADGGVLLEAGDAPAWANAIERVATDDDWAAALGRAGLARARTFTWPVAADRLHRAYVDAVGHRSGRA